MPNVVRIIKTEQTAFLVQNSGLGRRKLQEIIRTYRTQSKIIYVFKLRTFQSVVPEKKYFKAGIQNTNANDK